MPFPEDKRNTNGFRENPQNAIHTGRPRKFVSSVIKELKSQGMEPLKAREYTEIIEFMFNLTWEELKALSADKEQSYHTRTVATLLLKNPEKAHSDYSDRMFGRPKQHIDQTNTDITPEMTPEQLKQRQRVLYDKLKKDMELNE